jgi:very-short-patch-repair endonuclease
MRGKPDAIKQQFPIPQTLLLRNTVAHHRETIMRSQANIQRARLLRKQQTSAEIQLWQALRDRRLLGMKFRRQHCIGPFFVDFVCLDAKVIVEVDGSQHLERLKYDDDRTRFLELQGFCVLRFWNDVVFNAESVVLDAISIALQRAPHPPSAPSPTSRERERH